MACLLVSLAVHAVLLMSLDAYAMWFEPFSSAPKPRVELLRPARSVPGAVSAGAEDRISTNAISRGSIQGASKNEVKKQDAKREIKKWEIDKARELKKFRTEAERKLFLTYFELLSLSIRSHLKYPALSISKNEGGTAYLVFTLVPRGKLKDLKLRQSSGSPILDEAALQAIREASPFMPFPSGLGKEELNFYLSIRFNQNS